MDETAHYCPDIIGYAKGNFVKSDIFAFPTIIFNFQLEIKKKKNQQASLQK